MKIFKIQKDYDENSLFSTNQFERLFRKQITINYFIFNYFKN